MRILDNAGAGEMRAVKAALADALRFILLRIADAMNDREKRMLYPVYFACAVDKADKRLFAYPGAVNHVPENALFAERNREIKQRQPLVNRPVG